MIWDDNGWYGTYGRTNRTWDTGVLAAIGLPSPSQASSFSQTSTSSQIGTPSASQTTSVTGSAASTTSESQTCFQTPSPGPSLPSPSGSQAPSASLVSFSPSLSATTRSPSATPTALMQESASQTPASSRLASSSGSGSVSTVLGTLSILSLPAAALNGSMLSPAAAEQLRLVLTAAAQQAGCTTCRATVFVVRPDVSVVVVNFTLSGPNALATCNAGALVLSSALSTGMSVVFPGAAATLDTCGSILTTRSSTAGLGTDAGEGVFLSTLRQPVAWGSIVGAAALFLLLLAWTVRRHLRNRASATAPKPRLILSSSEQPAVDSTARRSSLIHVNPWPATSHRLADAGSVPQWRRGPYLADGDPSAWAEQPAIATDEPCPL